MIRFRPAPQAPHGFSESEVFYLIQPPQEAPTLDLDRDELIVDELTWEYAPPQTTNTSCRMLVILSLALAATCVLALALF